MRTNVFSKASAPKPGAVAHSSTASEFPSPLRYPTGGAPVQLKLTPQAFDFLSEYKLNVGSIEAFHAQVQKLDTDQIAKVSELLFQNRATLIRNTPEFDALREIVNRKQLMLALGDDHDVLAGADLGDFKEDPIKSYAAKPKQPLQHVAPGADLAPVAAEVEQEDGEAETAHYMGIERNQQQAKEKLAGAYIAKHVATWDPSKPFPDAKTMEKWATIRHHANDSGRGIHKVLLPFLYHRWGGQEVSDLALWLFDQSQQQVHASIGAFCEDALAKLSPAEFQHAAAHLASSMSVKNMADFLASSDSWSSRMAQHKTTFPLHVFFFPGYSNGKWQSMFQAAQKLYGNQGIELTIAKTTNVSKEKAKQMGFEDANPFFLPYSAKFKYGKNIKIAAQNLWATLQPDAKTLGIYVFGEFEDTQAPHTTVGTTFSTAFPMNDCIIIGDGGGNTVMTLAHELGHLMGGKGGEHLEEKDNIMHPTVTDDRTRVHLYQLAFMKAHPASRSKGN
jgi:hypothetical protein